MWVCVLTHTHTHTSIYANLAASFTHTPRLTISLFFILCSQARGPRHADAASLGLGLTLKGLESGLRVTLKKGRTRGVVKGMATIASAVLAVRAKRT